MPRDEHPARHGSRRPSTRALGSDAEERAEAFLTARGYRVIARNVYTRSGEIDRIACVGTTLCFVEVRLRRSDRFGTGAASVDLRKQRRVIRAAREWLDRREAPPHRAVRFDVVTLDGPGDAERIELIQGAFDGSSW